MRVNICVHIRVESITIGRGKANRISVNNIILNIELEVTKVGSHHVLSLGVVYCLHYCVRMFTK